jgi:hypothetical protein
MESKAKIEKGKWKTSIAAFVVAGFVRGTGNDDSALADGNPAILLMARSLGWL